LLDLALDFDKGGAGAIHHDVGDVIARQQGLERTVAEHVIADVVEQFLLLGNRHHDGLDRDDLVDDVADFLARGFAVELGELGEIDRFDQRAEDRALDLVIGIGMPRGGGGRGERGRRLAGNARLATARRRRWRRYQRGTESYRWNGRKAGLADAGRARRWGRGRRGSGCRRGLRTRCCGRLIIGCCTGTLTEHFRELRRSVMPTVSSASQAMDRAGRSWPSCFQGVRSARMRADGRPPWHGGLMTARRSSGRYWLRCRRSAARTG